MNRRRLNLYVTGVIAAALAVVATQAPYASVSNLPSAALLIAMSTLVGAWPVRVPSLRINLTAAHPFVLCALAISGPVAAISADLGNVLGAAIGRRQLPRLKHFVFNLASVALSSASAWRAFEILGGDLGSLVHLRLVPLLGASAAYFCVNTLLVAAAIALEQRSRLRATWMRSCAWTIVPFTGGVALASLMMVMFDYLLPWGVLIALPICSFMIVHYSLRRDDLEPHQRGA